MAATAAGDVFVASGVAPDDVRVYYEVPSNVVDMLRETIDPDETFVECLVRLLAEREGRTVRSCGRTGSCVAAEDLS